MTKLGSVLLASLMLLATTATSAWAESGDGLGHSPYAAEALSFGLNIGTLAAGETHWYVFNSSDLSNQPEHTLALHMVYRPSEYDVTPYVNFQILTFEQTDRWLKGFDTVSSATGIFTTTDFDQATSERLWSGSLLKGETYYIRVFNNSQRAVDYHLTALGKPRASGTEAGLPKANSSAQASSIVTPASASANDFTAGATTEETEWLLIAAAVQHMPTQEAATWLRMADQAGWLPKGGGAKSAEYSVSTAALHSGLSAEPATRVSPGASEKTTQMVPAPSLFDLYPNTYPVSPLALYDGANVGKLAPGGEHWYSFIHDDYDSDWYDYTALTLISTPTDGNTSHHINFQIFTGDQLHIWQRGTPRDMRIMGDGQWVSRDKDPVTGERIWAGKVVEGDLYFVRVFNHTDHVIDYYLITGDIINTELGNQVWAANPHYQQVFWQTTNYVRMRR